MKRMPLFLLLLVLSLGLFRLNEEYQRSPKAEEVIEVYSIENQVKAQEPVLPKYEDMATPTLSLVSQEQDMPNLSYDNSYTEICWNNCEDSTSYKFPEIHQGNVQIGDQLQADWSELEPQPTAVHFIQVDDRDKNNFREVEREQLNSENEGLTLTIDEETLGNHYALEFIWKEKTVVIGKTLLNFQVQ